MPDYGNVPVEDVAIIVDATHIAQAVTMTLPEGTPNGWARATYEAVLNAILRDWVRNRTSDLEDSDEQDLANMVRAAYDIANDQPEELSDITFNAVLRGLMDDWVENWNEE
jgi:hypothetical protein